MTLASELADIASQPINEVIARYRRLYSAAVYDILDELGLPNQVLAAEVKPVRDTMIVAAPAFTMKGIPDPVGNSELRARRINMFSDMRAKGTPLIDVRDTSFDNQVAHYGEMNATVGRSVGVVGAVIDGGCRDTSFLIDSGFPVFCRYQTPVEAFSRWSYYDWDIPVGMRGALTAIVVVNPGDFVFGDLDGVVIIPKELTNEVLLRAEALVARENEVRAEFESGADPVDVYRRHGRL